jgi:hypothetical protein
LNPAFGWPLPTFFEATTSVNVLPVALGSGGSTCAPSGGEIAAAPCSAGFASLKGKALAIASAAAIFLAAGSSLAAAAVPRREPLTVDFAVALAGDFFGGEAGFLGLAGMGMNLGRG